MTAMSQFSRRKAMFMPLLFPMALSACKNEAADVIRLSGATMGTAYSIVARDKSGHLNTHDVQSVVDQALLEIDASMSNWRADSEISQFNAQSGTDLFDLSPALARVMQTAQDVHNASSGRFDTTIGPLIELWGFGATGTQHVPTREAIAERQLLSGQSTVLELAAGAMRKKESAAHIYLAGIGKGYGADHVGRAIEALGVGDYLIEIGGDLYAKGLNPDDVPWQIGIEAPQVSDRTVFDVVGLSGMGLATSGDYRNYFEKDGQRFSHLIDPTTGRPVTHKTASATVLADNAMLADAWSTAMLILGRERGLDIAHANNIAVQFIEYTSDGGTGQFKDTASDSFRELTA